MRVAVQEKWFGIPLSRRKEVNPKEGTSRLVLGRGSHDSYAILRDGSGALVATSFEGHRLQIGERAVVRRRFLFHSTVVSAR